MKNTISTLVVLFSIISCTKSNEIKPTYLDSGNAATNTNVAASNETPVTLNGSSPNITPALTPSSAPPGALNPEHGKPGHRCDIPVGAPLNSPAKNTAQTKPQQITVNPTQTITPQSSAQKQKVAPGMNPPHGEPGHRCDIPVGQPLSSKPAAKSTTQTVTQNTNNAPLPVTVAAPANNTSVSTAKTTAPGMNPPHGEPGHRCDIPVGQPLK